MNVVVAYKRYNEINSLNIDVIKSISGVYNVLDLIKFFKNYYFNKLIIDVTSLKKSNLVETYKTLVDNVDSHKIVFLLSNDSSYITVDFLQNLVSIGIYNLTLNVNDIEGLIEKSNNKDDAMKFIESFRNYSIISSDFTTDLKNNLNNSNKDNNSVSNNDSLSSDMNANYLVANNIINSINNFSFRVSSEYNDKTTIIGFKNISSHAGSTTLIYMLLKELADIYGNDNVFAFEINSDDFKIFNVPNMVSANSSNIRRYVSNYSRAKIILVDLNDYNDYSFCDDVIFLLEPSLIKLNKLLQSDKLVFSKLYNKKVVLNQSLLLNKDVYDFEKEVDVSVFYNIPPLDARKRNAILLDFLTKYGLIDDVSNNSNKVFGLFRR